MTSRLRRTAISFGVLVVLYGTYALVAVPLIEPTEAMPTPTTARPAGSYRPTLSKRKKALFGRLFPQDHWAHHTPRILETEQALLIVKDWHPRGKGLWHLVPCAVVLFPGKEDRSGRGAIVLEAPQGARLQFDEKSDLLRAKIGKLLYGRIDGPVRIHGNGQRSAPDDDLHIVTRDLKITDNLVRSDAAVDFRIGPHQGHATGLEIRMMVSQSAARAPSESVPSATVRWIELKKDIRLQLRFADAAGGDDALAALSPAPDKQGPGSADVPVPAMPIPVRVRCRGPLHFDLQRRRATLEDHVDVERSRKDGDADTLACQLLTLGFAEREEASAKQTQPKASIPGWSPLAVRSFTAEGNPVRVSSPTTPGFVRCQKLHYDVTTRRIRLESPRRVTLVQGTNEVRAPVIEYEPPRAAGSLPDLLWASGPGDLLAVPGDDPQQSFGARWNTEVHLRRHGEESVLSMRGEPQLEMDGIGSLSGDRLHVYLREPGGPGAPEATRAVPDRLLVESFNRDERRVRIQSRELSGTVGRLEVWFEYPPEKTSSGDGATHSATTAGAARGPFQRPDEAFFIEGQLLRVRVDNAQHAAQVTSLTVDGDVHFRQLSPDEKASSPLAVRSNWLHVDDAHQPDAEVTIVGSPAHVLARGVTLQGGKMRLKRGENRFWIDTPGEMTLPIDRDLQGNPAGKDRRLLVSWQRRMHFDGSLATFEGDVVAREPLHRMETPLLKARLSGVAGLDGPNNANNVQLETVEAQGGFAISSRTLREGLLASSDMMTGKSFAGNYQSGDFEIMGPGKVTSVRRGGIPVPGPERTVESATDDFEAGDQLQYLCVGYPRRAEGNLHRREMTFLGHVQSVFGPVTDWNDTLALDREGDLRPNEVLLSSRTLTVRQLRSGGNAPRASVELEARGNVDIEGTDRQRHVFTAQAESLRYAEAKAMLVLESSRWSDAVVHRQEFPGGPVSTAKAGKVYYWLDTGVVHVDGGQILDLSSSPRTDKR